MSFKKPLHIFFAIFIALGLFLSPFSMNNSHSAVNLTESHCEGMANQNKMNDDNKLMTCCVFVSSAFITPLFEFNFSLQTAKAPLIITDQKIYYANKLESFARPPKSLS